MCDINTCMNYLKLNLPKPSEEILESLNQIANRPKTEEDMVYINNVRHWVYSNYPNEKNLADCSDLGSSELTELGRKEYGHLFEETVHVGGISLINEDTSIVARYPPHTDHYRITTLNYILSPGGTEVRTITYNQYDKEGYALAAGEMKYAGSEIDRIYQMNDQSWYGLDVKQYHSVENIETVRSIFSLSFIGITLDALSKKYPHLIEMRL